VTSLALTTLVVRDYDEAIAWFTTRLGFKLTADEPRENGKQWVTVHPTRGGAGLLLARAATEPQVAHVGDQTGGRVAFFLHTDDFDRDHAAYLSRGVEFTESPRHEEYGKVAVFRDLYGNKWDLVERRPAPSPPFDLDEAVSFLERTPAVLAALLAPLPPGWTDANEGPGSWSPFDIVGHLIHGEQTDWIPRAEHILKHGDAVPFAPFDREGMRREPRAPSIDALLSRFAAARTTSLTRLRALALTPADLERRGRHPALGPVTLGQLLATWVAHDLDHLAQVARVLAKRQRTAVGPWREYLPLLSR
jgi:catechol 2,3-dioxygenase-like lactoylglutathione lyase family enzyme